MPSPENRDANFMYGRQGHGQKKPKYSIWPSKTTHRKSERRLHETYKTRSSEWDTTWNTSSRPDTPSPRNRPSPQNQMDGRRDTPSMNRFRPRPSQPFEDPSSTASRSIVDERPFTMHPFSRLASTVKQCPWMLGSDTDFTAHFRNPEFYPPVPRSLMHDTAVSFVVTDFTRPEQPHFVISCPLEHVDFIQKMLAPEGSQRVLRARGSSGHPREGDRLRSMLLDGTPNIELALHGSGNCGSSGPANGPAAGGGGCVNERSGPPGVTGGPPGPYGGNPQGYGGPPGEAGRGSGWMAPMNWVPVPPGWYPGPQPPAAKDDRPPMPPASPGSANP